MSETSNENFEQEIRNSPLNYNIIKLVGYGKRASFSYMFKKLRDEYLNQYSNPSEKLRERLNNLVMLGYLEGEAGRSKNLRTIPVNYRLTLKGREVYKLFFSK